MWKEETHWTLLVEVRVDPNTVEINVEVPSITQNRMTMWPSYITPGYLPPGLKVSLPWRQLHIHVYSGAIWGTQL